MEEEFIRGIGEIVNDKEAAINCNFFNKKIPLKHTTETEIIIFLENSLCNLSSKAGEQLFVSFLKILKPTVV